MDDKETMFDEDWYANQFADCVERGEPWAVYYSEQLIKQMKHYLNNPPWILYGVSKDKDE